jgi:hypothetical protein
VGECGLAAQVDRRQVDLLHPAPRLEVRVEDGVVVGRRDPGVVERDVDRAVGVLGRLEQRVDLRPVGHVDVLVDGRLLAAELLGERLAAIVVDVADDHLGALGHEPLDGRQTDARAAAGDDRDPVLDTSSHEIPFRSPAGRQ